MKILKIFILFLAFSGIPIQPLPLNQKNKAYWGTLMCALFATELGLLALSSATISTLCTNDDNAKIFKYTAYALGGCAAASALAALTGCIHIAIIENDVKNTAAN